MNLHRTIGKSDWENIAPNERNFFQQIASRTAGLVTPGNIITLIGFGMVVFGLALMINDNLVPGLIWLILGRLLDIADGMAAEATGTKSLIGELFDAAADKLGTLLTVMALIVGSVIDWRLIAALAVPQVLISLVVLCKKYKNIALQPTRAGKLSMAFLWLAVAGLVGYKATEDSWLLAAVGIAAVTLSAGCGLYAAWQYAMGKNQA